MGGIVLFVTEYLVSSPSIHSELASCMHACLVGGLAPFLLLDHHPLSEELLGGWVYSVLWGLRLGLPLTIAMAWLLFI